MWNSGVPYQAATEKCQPHPLMSVKESCSCQDWLTQHSGMRSSKIAGGSVSAKFNSRFSKLVPRESGKREKIMRTTMNSIGETICPMVPLGDLICSGWEENSKISGNVGRYRNERTNWLTRQRKCQWDFSQYYSWAELTFLSIRIKNCELHYMSAGVLWWNATTKFIWLVFL